MSEAADGGAVEPDAVAGDPTQDDAARNADAEANRGRLIASLQEKAARVNAAEARAAALEAQIVALTRPAQSPAAQGNGDDPRQERIAQARDWADGRMDKDGKKDPVAGLVLDVLDELRMTQDEVKNLRKLDRITDEAKRERVQKHFEANTHRLGDIDAAKAEIDAKELAELNRAQQEQIDKLTKAMAQSAAARGPNVARTVDKEVTAGEFKERTMTGAEWTERQAELNRRRDDGDMDADRELRQDQLALRNGKIVRKG